MALKMIAKHCLEKVSATRFGNAGKPYKPNGKPYMSEITTGGKAVKSQFSSPLLDPRRSGEIAEEVVEITT